MNEEIIPAQQELIRVVQLPVIEEHLRVLKSDIEKQVSEAMSMAVSPETLQSCKETRAALNKRLESMESGRKAVKKKIMAPYEQFEAVYKECVSDPLEKANKDLGDKIKDVTSGIVQECAEKMQKHFQEACAAHDVTWLRWEQCPVKIGLTEAKQKSHKRLMDEINAFAENVGKCTAAISTMENAAEIMAEFKQTLDLPGSVALVEARHQRIAEEEKRKQEFEERRKAQIEALRRVEAAAPIPAPVPTPAPAPAPVQQEKTFKLNFSVCGTKPQLVKFKEDLIKYCEKEGIEL